ncbi:DUF317 domain-containing protein [Streptomyces sp. NPDC002520]
MNVPLPFRAFTGTQSPCDRAARGVHAALAHGWWHSIKTEGTRAFLAVEGLGSVRHRYASTGPNGPTWQVWAGYPGEPHCRARFSCGTPTTLAAAFTASLIPTAPLHRAAKDVPLPTRHHLYAAATAAPAHRAGRPARPRRRTPPALARPATTPPSPPAPPTTADRPRRNREDAWPARPFTVPSRSLQQRRRSRRARHRARAV